MSYVVTIRENATGELRTVGYPSPWEDHHFYMWIDGNLGCDCNLRAFFYGINADEDIECSEGDFTPLSAILENNVVIDIAAAARDRFGYGDDPRWQGQHD